MRIMMFILAIAGGLYAVIVVYMYVTQGKMVFVPSHTIETTPDNINIPFEELYLNVNSHEKIHAWYFPVDSSANTIIFCHGNAGNISHRMQSIQQLISLGVNLLIFDYRGFGLSDGTPSEENCYADAETAYNWLVEEKNIRPDKIILFGRSLGGAVAIDLATRVERRALVVESSFTSVVDVAHLMFPYLPIRSLLRYRFEALKKIGRVDCPVLVTHSREDDLIPFQMGQKLFEAARSTKRFFEFTGGHNDRDYLSDPDYRTLMQAFLTDPDSLLMEK